MMKQLRLLGTMCAFVFFLALSISNTVFAAPINYVYEGIGTGSLGLTDFTDREFVITASADTNNILPWPNADLQNTHLNTTIEITGLGLFTIITPSHTWIAETCCGGIGADLASNWITIDENGFVNVGYALDTNLGPIIDNSPGDVRQFTNVATTGGTLSFSSISTVTFTAVPIPAAAWLFGSGLLGLIGLVRHKKSA
jgi:hypothetical protein